MTQDVPARWVELVTHMEHDGLPSVQQVYIHLMEDGDARWSVTARGCEEVLDTLHLLCGMAGRTEFTPRVLQHSEGAEPGEHCYLVEGVPSRISVVAASRFLAEPVIDPLG